MTSEVIIDVQQNEISIALLEDKRLVSIRQNHVQHRSLLATYMLLK